MAKYITIDIDNPKTGIYCFEKKIDVDKKEKYEINIYAQTAYILFINDEYICQGPCRGKKEARYYDTIESDLKNGRNKIKVFVIHLVNEHQFSTVFKSEKPILIFEAVSDTNDIISDGSWECKYISGHKVFSSMYNDSVALSEELDAKISNIPLKVITLADKWGYDYEFDFLGKAKAAWGVFNFCFLEPRPIPMILPGKDVDFKIVKKGKNFVEYDAGEYVCAKVAIKITANCNAKIIYSECYKSPNGCKGKRDDLTGELSGMYDMLKSSDSELAWETYWFRAFRFIRIETENPDKSILSIAAKRVNYPLDITSRFNCSDEYYNKMYHISINTMLCCMHDIFMDCPHYEQQQYQMDTSIEANVSMRMSGDVRLIKKSIEDLAASQLSSGLLMANYPNSLIQVIPGFSFFWVFTLRDYLYYSKDSEFVYKHLGVMDKVLNYFDNEVRKRGYISTSIYWDYVDWVDEWEMACPNIEEGEILTIYNMYYLCALKTASDICLKLNKNNYADEYIERYDKLQKTVKDLCFGNELYTDGYKNKNYSAHTIIWAILSDIVSGDEAKSMMKNVFYSDISKPSFSMKYYLCRAIEKSGMYEEMAEGVLSEWKQMIDSNCTTWCETYPENSRSECHGWSSLPLYEFMTNVLGVHCEFDDVVIIRPQILHLGFARGSVPTRFGNIIVNWITYGGEFEIEIASSNCVEKNLIMPNGKEYRFNDTMFKMKCTVEKQK